MARSERNDALMRHKLIVDISISSIGVMISGTPTTQKYAMTENVASPCSMKSVPCANPSTMSKTPNPIVMAGTIACRLVNGPLHRIDPNGSGAAVVPAANTFTQTHTKLQMPVTEAWNKEYQLTPYACLQTSHKVPRTIAVTTATCIDVHFGAPVISSNRSMIDINVLLLILHPDDDDG